MLNKILARGQFRELQNMRVNSPTGGALGNISDTEGKRLREAFGAFDQTQGKEDFQKSIDDAINQLQFSKQNIAGAFNDTYSYRSGGASATPAASIPTVTSQKQYDALPKGAQFYEDGTLYRKP